MSEKYRATARAALETYVKHNYRDGTARALVRHAMWWGLPFTVLWSFGVDPVTAARVAIGPWLCTLIPGLLLIGMSALWVTLYVDRVPDADLPEVPDE